MATPDLNRLRMKPAPEDQAPSPEELLARIDQKQQEPVQDPVDPKRKREYVFPFTFTSEDGTTVSGRFKNRILNVQDRLRQGQLAHDLVGGRAFSSLPPVTQQLTMAISWMAISLDAKSRPEWAQNLSSLDDERVVLALFAEVWDHQATFLGRIDDAKPATQED